MLMDWLKDLYEKIRAEGQEQDISELGQTPMAWLKLTIIASALVLSIVAISIALVFAIGNRNILQHGQLQVFFFDAAEGRLYPEGRPWPTEDLYFWVDSGTENWDYNTKIVWAGTTIGLLSQPPDNSQLSSVWPAFAFDPDMPFFLYFHIQDRTLVATFHESYLEMTPLDEALFRSAFALTMMSLPFINDVVIRVGDMEWAETNATIANAPTISSAWLANTQLILYFLDDTGETAGLVREYYNAVGVDIQRRSRMALERLIEGSVSGNVTPLIPPETRVNAVLPATEIFSIYVNLSGEFMTRFSGSPTQARFMIQSIVNTVIENSSPPGSPPTARQVFFLIDSARHDTFHGVADFDRGFEYDETVMVGYVEHAIDAE